MKKRKLISTLFFVGLFLLVISLFLININFVSAHHEGITGKAVSGEVSDVPEAKVAGSLGEIDPSTGLPKKFLDFKEKADEFRYNEQNASYLTKEWTKILADNKFFGPSLFYTDKFFSLFNPLWKAIFGVEFSWSWAFFVGLFLWFIIIFVIYFPAKEIFENSLFALITGFIVASITGFFGVISKALVFATPFIKNIWILFILIIIAILLGVIYKQFFKSLKKESEEERLKRSKEAIKSHGEVSRKALEEMSK